MAEQYVRATLVSVERAENPLAFHTAAFESHFFHFSGGS